MYTSLIIKGISKGIQKLHIPNINEPIPGNDDTLSHIELKDA